MRRLGIALVAACPFPTWQGSQVLIRQMAEALAKRGHDVHLVTYGYGEYDLKPTYRVHRISAIPLTKNFRSGPSLAKPVLDLLLAAKLCRVVSREGIELIHAHNHEAVFVSWPASRIFGIPLVYHSHTILSEELPTYVKRAPAKYLTGKLARLLERFTLSLAHHLIAVSERELAFFARSGKRQENMTFIPPGIALEDSPHPETRAVEEEGTLCYVGNLDAYQDIPTLLRAVKAAAARREIRLCIVTRSEWREHERLACEMEIESCVRFVRPATFADAVSVMERSSLALITRNVPSGFPVKLLNYMACGKTIIATRSAGTGLTHGENGYIVEDGDHEGLAEAILSLLADAATRKRLGAGARELARKEFAWDARICLFEAIYERLLARREAVHAA